MLRTNTRPWRFAVTALTALALASTLACGPAVPAEFAKQSAQAQDAALRGDHLAAAEHWQRASQYADIDSARDEAIYRQATSLERGGQHKASVGILRQLATQTGTRQERAAYDLATQALLATPGDKGRQLERTLVQFPSSGVARGALDRWVRRLTPAERLEVLSRLTAKITDPALTERMILHQARNNELLGRLPQALERFTTLAQKFPYPVGQYWDEAVLGRAALQAHMGDRKAAINTLNGMLSHRESATLVGSYERRYSVATLMLAKFTATDNWRAAHTLLQHFPKQHPTSLAQDDALWAAALLARDNGDQKLACADADALHQTNGTSRYAACIQLVCPDSVANQEPACRDYVVQTRASFDAVIERAAAPYLRDCHLRDCREID